MGKTDRPARVADADLDGVEGGGLTDTQPGPTGYEPVTLERGLAKRYIGETEKNVWKAPANVKDAEG